MEIPVKKDVIKPISLKRKLRANPVFKPQAAYDIPGMFLRERHLRCSS